MYYAPASAALPGVFSATFTWIAYVPKARLRDPRAQDFGFRIWGSEKHGLSTSPCLMRKEKTLFERKVVGLGERGRNHVLPACSK